MKVTDLKQNEILVLGNSDSYFLAKIVSMDLDSRTFSVDKESHQKGNMVIGKLTIFSKAIGDGVSYTKEFVLEETKDHILFFWMRQPSILAGMPTHSKTTILSIVTNDL